MRNGTVRRIIILTGAVTLCLYSPGALSQARSDIGINITWPADWSQDHSFADVMKNST